MKRIGLVVCLASFLGLGVAAVRTTQHADAKPSDAREWPMTTRDQLAISGIREGLNQVQGEIARIASGDQALEKRLVGLLVSYRALDRANDDLLHEVQAERGVACVQSGASWVELRK